MVTEEHAQRAAAPKRQLGNKKPQQTWHCWEAHLHWKKGRKKPNSCERIGRWNFNFSDSLGFVVTHEAPAIRCLFFFSHPVYLEPNVSVLILHNWSLDLFRMHSFFCWQVFRCYTHTLEFSITLNLLKVSCNDLIPSSAWKAIASIFFRQRDISMRRQKTLSWSFFSSFCFFLF